MLKFEKIFKCFTQSIFKKLMKVYKGNFRYFFKELHLHDILIKETKDLYMYYLLDQSNFLRVASYSFFQRF